MNIDEMPLVIVTGTDSSTSKGGIGVAVANFKTALSRHFEVRELPTFNPYGFKGKIWPFLRAQVLLPLLIYKQRNRRVIVYSHAGAGASLLRELITTTIAKLFGAKAYIQIHSISFMRLLDSPVKRVLLRLFLGKTKLILLTSWMRKEVEKKIPDISLGVAPNPIEVSLGHFADIEKDIASDLSDVRLLCMTRFIQGKNVDCVIKALKYLPNRYVLDLAGDGPLKSELEDLVAKEQLNGRVRFLGFVQGEEKNDTIKKADIFCLPTSNDSFGVGFIEAMSYGVPVVAYRWGPIEDVIEHTDSGLLVDKLSPQDISAAILSITINNEVFNKYRKQAYALVNRKYSCAVVGEQLAQLFCQLEVVPGCK